MKTYHLFISHSWSYSDQYERLTSLLTGRGYFEYKNYSVPKYDPIHNAPSTEKLKAAIKEQIAHASVVLIMAGVYSTYSKWIDIEIELAKAMGKPIIAIEPWGSERTSYKVKENATRTVAWNSNSIVDAIREVA